MRLYVPLLVDELTDVLATGRLPGRAAFGATQALRSIDPGADEEDQGWWDMNVNAVGEEVVGDALAEKSDAPKRKREGMWLAEEPALEVADD